MGIFDYDGFLVKMLTKAGNMMIVSFFWLVSCIPVVTVIPATSALFHTTVKVIRQSGTGVARDFFRHLRDSLKQGVLLSVICVISGLLLYTALDFGRQVWQNSFFWTIYYVFGFFLAFSFISMILFIPPTLSRFECGVTTILRLSLYFSSRNLLRTIWFMLLLGFMVLLVYIYPVTILILPGLYFDLICAGMEKTLVSYIVDSGLVDENGSQAERSAHEDTEAEIPEISALELDRLMDGTDKDTARTAGETDE